GGGAPAKSETDGPRQQGPAGAGNEQPAAGQGPDENSAAASNAAGGGSTDAPDTTADEHKAEVDQAAQAAGLALKRLQKELERGEVDPELLQELGWTKDELSKFADRMQQQLDER
ncbi:MAG: hypothetical protein ACKPJJ_32110, partial [Planctomycetaceae bacterium]